MDQEFIFKLGILLGSLDDYLSRVEETSVMQNDTDKIRTLLIDVKKKFFAKDGVKK